MDEILIEGRGGAGSRSDRLSHAVMTAFVAGLCTSGMAWQLNDMQDGLLEEEIVLRKPRRVNRPYSAYRALGGGGYYQGVLR